MCAGIIALFGHYYHYQLFEKMLMSFRKNYDKENIFSIFFSCVDLNKEEQKKNKQSHQLRDKISLDENL